MTSLSAAETMKNLFLNAKNRHCLFTFVLRTCEDDRTFGFRR